MTTIYNSIDETDCVISDISTGYKSTTINLFFLDSRISKRITIQEIADPNKYYLSITNIIQEDDIYGESPYNQSNSYEIEKINLPSSLKRLSRRY